MKTNPKSTVRPGDRLVPHDEAAEMLGLTPKALYHKCYRGEGPKHVHQPKKGGKRSYLHSEIMEMMSKHLRLEGVA